MAIGFGRVLGFDLGINFNYPYFATSIRDFWTRWHISLSSWIRDYLYIPLGGSRYGIGRTYSNLIMAMMLCGLWHGANWTFMIWGGLHGLLLVLQRLLTIAKNKVYKYPLLPAGISRVFNVLFVFLLVSFSWIFFRAQTMNDAFQIISGILHFDNLSFSALPFRFFVTKGLILIFFLVGVEALIASRMGYYLFNGTKFRLARNTFLIWSIPLLGSFSDQTFIYTQF